MGIEVFPGLHFYRKYVTKMELNCGMDQDGYCRVKAVKGGGTGQILIPDPNTNLMHAKTRIPMAAYEIRRGTQTIQTQVDYL